jgi:hypothetical protein
MVSLFLMENYNELKEIYLGIIKKIKLIDAERGAYLDRHIVFDDMNSYIFYTGTGSIANVLMTKIKLID